MNKLRAFIAQAPADKEVQISSTDVHRSDIDKIKLQLRGAAIENSKQTAQKIATAYGLKIVGVYSVSEVAPDFAYGIQAGSWRSGGSEEVTVTGAARLEATTLSSPSPVPSLRVGTKTIQQNIYSVYLTAAK